MIKINDYDRMAFNVDHILMRNTKDNGWVAVNKHTHMEVSPTYSDPKAAIYFVIRILNEQMDKCIEEVLTNDVASLHEIDKWLVL